MPQEERDLILVLRMNEIGKFSYFNLEFVPNSKIQESDSYTS